MSWIYEGLPKSVEIDGKEYEIRTDFKNWLRFSALLDSGLSPGMKASVMMAFFIGEDRPHDIQKAMKALVGFASRYQPPPRRHGKATMDLERDADYIYAGFLGQYGIDLLESKMHWWVFLALLDSLRECKLTDIIEIRGMDAGDYKDAKTKKKIRELQRVFQLEHGAPEGDGDVFGMFE